MHRLALSLALFLACPIHAQDQWQIQESHTHAGLRGIHSIGNGAAWASGTEGTVLRTTDGGGKWETCSIPTGAEKLDFRGIQAFDRNTAIVMSSGTGELSRLYKTTDGCRSWKLVLANPDPEGFWDAIQFTSNFKTGLLYGDPVRGHFVEFTTSDFGVTWLRSTDAPSAREGESLFAASNSSLLLYKGRALIVTGGASGSRSLSGGAIPLAASESAGAFSVAASPGTLVAVGGDYRKPDSSQGTAAFSTDGGQHWTAATTSPHGYRSSVAYESRHKIWIAAGPNGTDISTDGGRNWRPDADGNWNALSLPFAVGPNGRIARRGL
jgi:photosystem II stability/assembly factor-like uncharacterized protein